MKARQAEDGAAAAAAAALRKRKNRQRLGGKGGGLSLESFANAKSTATGYNPALIKKQREFYRNAKIVKKYKKSLKQQNHDGRLLPAVSVPESWNGNENANRKKPKKKTTTNRSLQSIREEYEKQQEDKERARKERGAMIQAKKEERQRAEVKRKALKEKMFKRTSSGQPVMKYRIEHLLENIRQSSSN